MDSLPPDPYKVLGVDKNADKSEIRSAYKQLVLKNHPDKFEDPTLKSKQRVVFNRTQRAWELIDDDDAREKYKDQVKRKQRIDALKEEKERTDFIEFALKLFDETSRATQEPEVQPSPVVEERTQQKERVSEHPKAAASSDSVPSEPVPSLEKSAKSGKLFAVPATQLNLEQMNPALEDPQVDLVAVHGLGAIPNITWTEKKSETNWLSDERMLPAAAPKARILRFGYDSLWMGETPIRTTLSTIAIKLLLCLSVARTEELDRPLIFIGHCFGGLVIERVLILAKMQPKKYPSLFDSSIGVVFLGTPHRGSSSFTQDSTLLSAIAASSDLYQNPETEVLHTMTSRSGSLLDVSDDFITLCVNDGPKVSCFFEQRPSKLGKVIGRNDIQEFIVDAKSATFDGHPKYGLEVDHFSLNKFDGPTNPNYVQIRAVIVELYQAALRSRKQPPSMDRSVSSPTTRAGRRRLEAERSKEFPDPAPSKKLTGDQGDVEEIRKEAIRELHEEEARKSAALRDIEYQKRLAKEKLGIEQAYRERLKKNMLKYGVADPDTILGAHPLPKDQDLQSELEIHDKERWHKCILKSILTSQGLDGGQIDEVLNDTGETMVVDGVETAFTRMAKKWVSSRTLDAYGIPWQDDKNDPSAIIITRWVPEYEQEFIWDHTHARRTGREKKRDDASDRVKAAKSDAKNNEHREEEQGKTWLLRNWEKFKAAQKEASTSKKEQKSADKSTYQKSPNPYAEPMRTYYDPSQTSTKKTFSRSASQESIRSAPDMEEVSRRRRHSRTLSQATSPTTMAPGLARSSSPPTAPRDQPRNLSDSDDEDHHRRRRRRDRRRSPERDPYPKHYKVKLARTFSPQDVKYSEYGYQDAKYTTSQEDGECFYPPDSKADK